MAKAIIEAETNIGKVRQIRSPKDYSAIEKGALALELEERVNLRNAMTISIDAELKQMEDRFNRAKQLVTVKN